MTTVASRLSSYTTLGEALRDAPRNAPFVTMCGADGGHVATATFGEFKALAAGFGALLARNGVNCGDRVILVMPQGIPLMAAFAGAILYGAVPAVLAYPTFKVDPTKYRTGLLGAAANLGASCVLISDDFPADLQQQLDSCSSTLVTVGSAQGLTLEADPPAPRPVNDPAAVAFIQHSAGTTGLQKAVALSHAAVLRQLSHLSESLEVSPDDGIVSWLPLYHDMGLIAAFMLPMACHLPVVMQSPTDWVVNPASMLELASRHRSTLCWIPNFAFQLMARRPSSDRTLDLRPMRAFINCSEPVRARSFDDFHRVYEEAGVARSQLQTSYAMAENTFAVTQSPLGEPPTTTWVDRTAFTADDRVAISAAQDPAALPLVSSGRCLPANAVSIRTVSGEPLSDQRIGDIWVRSDSLFDGYYNRPDLSTRALAGGWYRTGDRGFTIASDVYVIGRADDMMIVGGRNVYPEDIEEVAAAHPRVRDGRVVAFAIENADLGTQDVIILAEPDVPGAADGIEADIRQAVSREIGIAPRAVHVVPPRWIVKSTAGKPARAENRRRFLEHGHFSSLVTP